MMDNDALGSRLLGWLRRWLDSQGDSARAAIVGQVRRRLRGYLVRYADRLKERALRIVATLWQAMNDPAVPLRAKTTAICALLYFISPLDAIPDVFPGGLADDAAVLAAAAAAIVQIIAAHRGAPRK